MAASSIQTRADRRSSDRVSLGRRAVLRFEGSAEEVHVEDFGRDGCRIVAATKFEPFAEVSIGFAGVGHTPARLVWRNGDQYGCAFEQTLPAPAAKAALAENVAYLPENTEPRDVASGEEQQDEAKYSLGARVGIIAGLTLLLWSPIIAAVALLL